jgi:flavin reductase (DIM6/NTAB) family NADH-FMN oxidoreductase RutF
MQSINTDHPIWERFFTVNPLVIVGSKEEDGRYDLAPKHMAFPLGWKNYFGFVCTPRHGTYQNIKRTGEFSVSYPKPTQVVITSLTATPRCDDDTKPGLDILPQVPAETIDSVFVENSYLQLECKLEKIIDGFGENSLITGRVVNAFVDEHSLRSEDKDDNELIFHEPLLAYLAPGRYAVVKQSHSFPFPKDFKK